MTCGANTAWINGNIVVDRDRFNQDRKFGVSIAGGVVVFGVSGNGTGDRTICGTTSVLDDAWHHVAVQRRRSDGFMSLYVDGTLQASADGPDGDVSYPDNGVPGNFCGGPCMNSDPFLVLGAEKHDAGAAFPSYRGLARRAAHLACFATRRTSRGRVRRSSPTPPPSRSTTSTKASARERTTPVASPASGGLRTATSASRRRAPLWSTDTPFDFGALALDATIRRTRIASGFSHPVDIVAAPGDTTRLFVVEQAGPHPHHPRRHSS